jgi:uncharacterized protein (DUF302 family)
MTDSFTLDATIGLPFDDALEATRAALAEQGFGIISEIDLAATLMNKIGAEVAPQVILGACRPQLAYQAIQVDPAIAALLPCNVVVRAINDTTTSVQAFDPAAMTRISDHPAFDEVATDARTRLIAALDTLTREN